MPEEPALSGFAFASAMSSFTDLAGTAGFTIRMLVESTACVTGMRSLKVSNGIFLERLGLITSAMVPSSTVCPSGTALETMSAAMVPEWPGRLSTMTCWPRLPVSLTLSARAVTSVPPPGAKPMTRRTGLVGQSAATAGMAAASRATAARVHEVFMFSPRVCVSAADGASRHAGGRQLRGERVSHFHRPGVGFALADDIVGRAVRGRSEHRLEAGCHGNALVEAEQLGRDLPLVVVHHHHAVEFPVLRLEEDRVGRNGAGAVHALRAHLLHGRPDDADFLVPEQPVLAAVRIEGGDTDARAAVAGRA